MDLKEIQLTPWNDKYKDDVEEMIVVGDHTNPKSRLRLRQNGEVNARPFARGEKVKLSGGLKKRLYYRLAVCYPKDWPRLKQYLEQLNEKPQIVDESNPVATNKELDALKKQNADLQKKTDDLQKVVEDLKAVVEIHPAPEKVKK